MHDFNFYLKLSELKLKFVFQFAHAAPAQVFLRTWERQRSAGEICETRKYINSNKTTEIPAENPLPSCPNTLVPLTQTHTRVTAQLFLDLLLSRTNRKLCLCHGSHAATQIFFRQQPPETKTQQPIKFTNAPRPRC